MSVLGIAEHDNASIRPATLNTVTAGAQCGGDVHVLVLVLVLVLVAGANAAEAAKAASQIAGVAKVIHAEGEQFLFAATASGKNIAPHLAAKLDDAQVRDITKVVSADTFERPIYAGNAIATVQSADSVKVVTVRTTAFDPAATTGGSASVESASAVADAGKNKFDGSEIAKSDRAELTARRSSFPAAARSAPAKSSTKCWSRSRTRSVPPSALRVRHQRRDPAPRGHEGFEGDRGDQQGPGSSDLLRRRLRGRSGSVHGLARIHRQGLKCSASAWPLKSRRAKPVWPSRPRRRRN
jgi:hypothetical protein